MKSRTSFCNAAVLKRTLYKGLPVWGAYLLIWLVVLPMMFYSGDRWREAMDLREYILSIAAHSSQPVGAIYGLASAAMVFLYLYKSRTANFFASLPLTRGEMFRTNFLAGLLYAVVPNLIVALACVPAAFSWGMFLLKDLAIWFVVMTLIYLFYYSFAVLLALIVSNLIALPLIYGVLNFTAIVIETIIRSLLSYFIYGYYNSGDFLLEWASPLFYTMVQGDGMDVIGVWDSVSMTNTDYYIIGWNIVWIMAAVSVVLIAAAYVVNHFRRMESAGDVIAVRRLKPVFLYCFTVGCSIVLGYCLAELLLNSSIGTKDFAVVLLCMIAGAFVGYFVGQMMLHKTLRVFGRRNWRNWAIVSVLVCAVMLCTHFDVLGYAGYVPETEDVQAVAVGSNNNFTEDPALIEAVRELHQTCIDHQREIEQAEKYGLVARVYVDYQLKDGRLVQRMYPVPNEWYLSRELVDMYEGIFNDPDYKVLRSLPENYTAEDITYCTIYNYRNEQEILLTRQEAYEFLKTCVEPDLRDSSMEDRYWMEEPVGNSATVTVSESKYAGERFTSINIQIEFDRALNPELYRYGNVYCYFDVTYDASRILAYAAERGVEPWTEEQEG